MVMFSNFCIMNNNKMANYSTTTEARVKISTGFGILRVLSTFYYVYLNIFKKNN
jgi:hypothetical protein